MKARLFRTALSAACTVLFLGASASHAMDDNEVKSLLKKNNCMKCHTPEKAKDGPSYKEIAAKYRDKPDAAAEIHKHVTTFGKVEIKGKEEDHEPLKTKKEDEINAVVQWILSRP